MRTTKFILVRVSEKKRKEKEEKKKEKYHFVCESKRRIQLLYDVKNFVT